MELLKDMVAVVTGGTRGIGYAIVKTYLENGRGVILNTSSMVSIYGQPAGVGYPASKFAVNGMTKSLARELAKDKIRVNAVAPGVTDTDMVANLPEQTRQYITSTIPLGRGTPQDIANARSRGAWPVQIERCSI